VPILAIAVTTIECDGHDGAVCPNNTVVEYPHPQSVSIRLAKQSGWTVWIETMCPECTHAVTAEEIPVPLVPVSIVPEPAATTTMVLAADPDDAQKRFVRINAEPRVLVDA
jgi:hypothetical protein